MGKRTRPKKTSVRLEVTFLQRKADSISDVNPKIDKASGLVKLWKQVPDIFSDINEDTSIDELHDHFEDLFDDPLQCQLIGYDSSIYTFKSTTKGLGSIYGRRVKDRDGSDPTMAITKAKLRAIDDDVTFKDLVTRCSEAKGYLAIGRSRFGSYPNTEECSEVLPILEKRYTRIE